MNELKDYRKIIGEKARRAENIFDKYPEQSKKFKARFEEINIDKIEPEIMVYGIYNAGKSSILNELIGEDRASVADVPETDSINRYEWNGYSIADTPGVFAPKKHEEVTQAHLRKADIVMFVMSTTGSNEKLENYTRMKAIADAGKKIIIVLNDKDGYMGANEEALRRIKQKVVVNMNQLGIDNVEEKYCIVTVNAARARTGRLKNKVKLIEKSGLNELKNVIVNEPKRTPTFDILRRRLKQLEQVLDQFAKLLEGQQDSDEIRKINRVLETLSRQKLSLRRQIGLYIDRQTERLANTLPQLIWSNRTSERLDELISREVSQLYERVQSEIRTQLEEVEQTIELEIKTLEDFKANSVDTGSIQNILKKLETSLTRPDESIAQLSGTPLDPKALMQTASSPGEVSTKIAAGLVANGAAEIAKELAKTELGKAIAKTAIGKTLGSAVGSVLPIVGPVITMVGLLKTFLGDDGEGARLEAQAAQRNARERQRIEAEMQARQELNQKCRYMADNLADEMKNAVNKSLGNAIEGYEQTFKEELARHESDEHKRANDIGELRGIIEEYDHLAGELGGN
mgnify:CR=1 FL=1